LLAAGAATGAITYPVVDTGQTKCYNAITAITAPTPGQAFYGQDAQFAGNPSSYTLSNDGLTVYDTVTGLTWQRSPDTNGDGALTTGDKFTWAQAQARPAALNAVRYGGFTDWRLPTIKELYSLIDFRGTDPSGFTGTDTLGLTPFINTKFFAFAYGQTSAGERVIDSQYASKTLYVNKSFLGCDKLFGVNFADGRIKGYDLTMPGGAEKTFFVLCVRGNAGYGRNTFVDNADGTVTDTATGLMWSQADSQTALDWQHALAWVQTKNAAKYLNHTDWRLPNAKELQSIVDYTRSPDSSNSPAIDPVFSATAIINEAGSADYPCYWTGTTHAASDGTGGAGIYIAFGRAMGYLGNAWRDVHGAGAQRSDPKSGNPANFPVGRGPQGDAIRIYNYVRLVRDAGALPPPTTAPEIHLYDGGMEITNGTGTITFDATTVGTPVQKIITVKNLGAAPLTLTPPITVPTGFAVAAGLGAVTLAPAASTTFTLQLTAASVGNFSGPVSLVSTDTRRSPFTFTVAGSAANAGGNGAQPDLLIRTANEAVYTGGGIFNTTGDGQSKALTVAAGGKAVYYLKVVNAGAAVDNLIIYSLGDPAWMLHFFDAPTGGHDVTALVAGPYGWTLKGMPVNSWKEFRVELTPAPQLAHSAFKVVPVLAISATDNTKRDEVKATTTKQ